MYYLLEVGFLFESLDVSALGVLYLSLTRTGHVSRYEAGWLAISPAYDSPFNQKYACQRYIL
jgi:hypothetical protein